MWYRKKKKKKRREKEKEKWEKKGGKKKKKMTWVISDRLNDHLIWTAFFVPFFIFISLCFFPPPPSLSILFSPNGEKMMAVVSSLSASRTGNRNALAIFQLSKRGTGLNFAPSFFPLYDSIEIRRRGSIKRGKNGFHRRVLYIQENKEYFMFKDLIIVWHY